MAKHTIRTECLRVINNVEKRLKETVEVWCFISILFLFHRPRRTHTSGILPYSPSLSLSSAVPFASQDGRLFLLLCAEESSDALTQIRAGFSFLYFLRSLFGWAQIPSRITFWVPIEAQSQG